MKYKKVLDISELIEELRTIVNPNRVVNSGGNKYFGRVTFCFEDGRMTHIEKVETMK